jgi:hypothetical protein
MFQSESLHLLRLVLVPLFFLILLFELNRLLAGILFSFFIFVGPGGKG